MYEKEKKDARTSVEDTLTKQEILSTIDWTLKQEGSGMKERILHIVLMVVGGTLLLGLVLAMVLKGAPDRKQGVEAVQTEAAEKRADAAENRADAAEAEEAGRGAESKINNGL